MDHQSPPFDLARESEAATALNPSVSASLDRAKTEPLEKRGRTF